MLTWQLVVVESILLKFDLNTRNLLKSSRKSWIMDRNFRGAANAGQQIVSWDGNQYWKRMEDDDGLAQRYLCTFDRTLH